MLAHSVRPCTSPLVLAGAFRNHSNAVSHLPRRHFWHDVIRKAEAEHVKHIKAEIRRINDNPSFSAEYKYRNSHQLFAQLDYCKVQTELTAVTEKFFQLRSHVRIEVLVDKSNPDHVLLSNTLNELRAVHRKVAAVRWDAVELNIFASRGDVQPTMRLAWILKSVATVAIRTVQRIILCVLAFCLRQM